MNLSSVSVQQRGLLLFEPFAPAGLETVSVLRPAKDVYRCGRLPTRPALVLVPASAWMRAATLRQLPLGALAEFHTLQANNDAVTGETGFGHFCATCRRVHPRQQNLSSGQVDLCSAAVRWAARSVSTFARAGVSSRARWC